MTGSTRAIAAILLAGVWTAGFVLAQAPAPTPPGQTVAPGGQGQGRQGQPAPAGRGRQGRRGGFAPFVRPPAPQDVLVRGQALYDANCASCHAPDLRGTPQGPNLLRSGVALRDQKGELIGAAIARHTPSLTLIAADSVAVSEYVHSIHSTMGGQGSPPRGGSTPNVLVGDPQAGGAQFDSLCAACHSPTRDLQGVASRFPDARALQNAWIAGSSGGGGRGGSGAGHPAVVTLADGSTLEGTLVRQNDFLVILRLPDGTRRSIARTDGVPAVEVKDPQQAHKDMALKLAFDDPDNRKMHDITAYLWTLK
jgi:cytochrome c oxidase cbb3-type subunit 3